MRSSPEVDAVPRIAADILARLRGKPPRVHCITNSVAQNFTANVLLALGALPSMTISSEEIGLFAQSADALLVNLGTFDRERAAAIEIAVTAANKTGKPWVLDPVLIERSPPRATLARQLLDRDPKVLRLNAAEFSSLSDTAAGPDAVKRFASARKTVVALSGATDLVSDGNRFAAIANGHALMARITAMGCAASAIVAACLALEADAWVASVAGLLILGIAGELAGEQSNGPGSFAVALLDVLHRLDGTALLQKARVS